jgi:hypothetical protein
MILEMDIEEGIELILRAYEKRSEERAFQLYLTKYPWMNEENYMPFEEFYNPKTHNENKHLTEEQILLEVKDILDSFKGGGTHGNI